MDWNLKATSTKGPRAVEAGPWLVFADRSGLGTAIEKHRKSIGEKTILVTPGKKWSIDGTSATIRPNDASDYQRLMKAANHTRTIVYLWSSDVAPDDVIGASITAHAEQALLLLQSVLAGMATNRPRLWFITSGAQKVVADDSCDAPGHAMLWGLCRALSAEHAELWGGLIDVDNRSSPSEAARHIVREVDNGDEEDKISFRSGKRYVPRLERRKVAQDTGDDFVPRSNVTYLITGGLGGIGLAIARWLVERGARHLLLLGRTPLPAPDTWLSAAQDSPVGRKIASITAMRSLGASVDIAAVDITDQGKLERCLAERAKCGAPDVRGVFHAAGILQFEALETQSADSLHAGLAAKALGAWHLHRQFEHQPLDCFVMCSSSSALLNSPLLGGYAAGNAYLDALAAHRQARGLKALSVNWGTWGEVGMAAETSRGDLLTGFNTIGTVRGLSALAELLRSRRSNAAVMPVNWHEVANAYPAFASDPFLERLTKSAGAGAGRSIRLVTREKLLAAEQSKQHAQVLEYLHDEAARVLGTKAHDFDSDTPLSSMGLDSLMAVQLKNKIEADLGVSIPIMRFLQGPAVSQLAPSILDAIHAFKPLSSEASPIEVAELEWEEGTI